MIMLLTACGAPDTGAVPTNAPANQLTADTGPCAPAALRAYQVSYTNVIDRWGAAVIQAGQAKPADLNGPISTLQKIADDLGQVQSPQCAQAAHAESIDAMNMPISGYRDLMAQKDVGSTLREAIDKLASARTQINALPNAPGWRRNRAADANGGGDLYAHPDLGAYRHRRADGDAAAAQWRG